MSDDIDVWATEQVITCRDDASGLLAVIAVDDTTRGPGFGGVRLRGYASTAAAIAEAQRLAAAMTYKHALAELPYGGAKSVILDDGRPRDAAARLRLFEAFGRFVARTNGTYIPGVDMGTTLADMRVVREQGARVYCADHDPAPWTARGVYAALRAGAAHALGCDVRGPLDGVRIAVQGVGSVGGELARLAAADGARLVVADTDQERAAALAAEVGGEVVAPDEAPFADVDVFAPCAVARVLTRGNVARVRARVVAGAANDTLDEPAVADALAAAGVAFVPDFVANAGGVVHEHARAMGWDEARLAAEVDHIGARVTDLLAAAERDGVTPVEAARRVGRERLGR